MTDLVLDPDDGRETGLKMPRHVFTATADIPNHPHEALLDDTIRRTFADYTAQVAAKAEELAEYGLALEEVQIGPASDWSGDTATIRLVGTYRIVRLNPDGGEPQ